eukprot:704940-Amphidinium_carterae.1
MLKQTVNLLPYANKDINSSRLTSSEYYYNVNQIDKLHAFIAVGGQLLHRLKICAFGAFHWLHSVSDMCCTESCRKIPRSASDATHTVCSAAVWPIASKLSPLLILTPVGRGTGPCVALGLFLLSILYLIGFSPWGLAALKYVGGSRIVSFGNVTSHAEVSEVAGTLSCFWSCSVFGSSESPLGKFDFDHVFLCWG